jgi:hypothetical protein
MQESNDSRTKQTDSDADGCEKIVPREESPSHEDQDAGHRGDDSADHE